MINAVVVGRENKPLARGIPLGNFISSKVEKSLTTIAGQFNFQTANPDGFYNNAQIGDEVEVYVNGDKIAHGYIEILDISYDSGRHSVSFSGRDKTGDIVDSSVDAMVLAADKVTIVTLAEAILKDMGSPIKVIGVENEYSILEQIGEDTGGGNPIQAVTAGEGAITIEKGDNAFAVLEKYARQKQVLLTCDENGDLVITRGTSRDRMKGTLVNRIDTAECNILSANVTHDSTHEFNESVIFKQESTNKNNPMAHIKPENLTVTDGRLLNSEIRAGRKQVFENELSSWSTDTSVLRHLWEVQLRKANRLKYSVVYAGSHINDELFLPNRIIEINDDYSSIIGPMLIEKVEHSYSLSEGQTTRLTLVDINAYAFVRDSSENVTIEVHQ